MAGNAHKNLNAGWVVAEEDRSGEAARGYTGVAFDPAIIPSR